VQVGRGVGARHGIAEQPVAASDDERSDGVLTRIVRDRPGAVLDVTDQLGPLAVQVVQGFAEGFVAARCAGAAGATPQARLAPADFVLHGPAAAAVLSCPWSEP